MKISLSYGDTAKDIKVSRLVFSGGEVHPRLEGLPFEAKSCHIRVDLRSSDDVMELLLVTNAIRQKFRGVPVDVTIPYFPYARQDRACYEGEACSVQVMADLINLQGYNSVTLWDPHSNVTPALITNVRVLPASNFVGGMVPLHDTVLVCPDAGARHRVEECSYKFNLPMIECTKKRNPKDGSLTDSVVPPINGADEDKTFLIVDDICDGGRTFTNLAKELRRNNVRGDINLYVTHGIFSKGLVPLKAHFKKIYCPNPWPGHNEYKELITL